MGTFRVARWALAVSAALFAVAAGVHAAPTVTPSTCTITYQETSTTSATTVALGSGTCGSMNIVPDANYYVTQITVAITTSAQSYDTLSVDLTQCE